MMKNSPNSFKILLLMMTMILKTTNLKSTATTTLRIAVCDGKPMSLISPKQCEKSSVISILLTPKNPRQGVKSLDLYAPWKKIRLVARGSS